MKPRIPRHTATLIPPVLAAFLSCLFIVIRPLARLSPPYAFLILTIQILYFYPSGTLVAQLESSALAFVGACVSLGFGNLVLWLAVVANRRGDGGESVGARTACALGLAVLALVSEFEDGSPKFPAASLTPCSWMGEVKVAEVDERR